MRAAVLVLTLLLAGCVAAPKADPLVTAACPALAPIEDPSFGATTLKLIAVGDQYNQCRCAALPGVCKPAPAKPWWRRW